MINNKQMLSKLLSKNAFLQVNKQLAHDIGVYEAILLAELIYLDDVFEDSSPDGYFFRTFDDLQLETALTRKQLLKPISKLEKIGFIDTINRGIPQKKHYKINHNAILYYLNNSKLPDGTLLNNPNDNYISKKLEKKDKRKNNIIVHLEKRYTCVSNFFNIVLTKEQENAIKLNSKIKDIESLCKDFSTYMFTNYDIELCLNNQAILDIESSIKLKSGIVGLMFMYSNDFEKFENIMKQVY